MQGDRHSPGGLRSPWCSPDPLVFPSLHAGGVEGQRLQVRGTPRTAAGRAPPIATSSDGRDGQQSAVGRTARSPVNQAFSVAAVACLPNRRYMATSDLANELAKESFRFDSPTTEKQAGACAGRGRAFCGAAFGPTHQFCHHVPHLPIAGADGSPVPPAPTAVACRRRPLRPARSATWCCSSWRTRRATSPAWRSSGECPCARAG